MNRISFLLLTVLLTLGARAQTFRLTGPWVFSGYRSLPEKWVPDTTLRLTPEIWAMHQESTPEEQLALDTDSLLMANDSIPVDFDLLIPSYKPKFDSSEPFGPNPPEWLAEAIYQREWTDNFMYETMVVEPRFVQYAEWQLPVPPTLHEDDPSFLGFIRRQKIPHFNLKEAEIEELKPERQVNWLHTLNIGLQLSQAYISANWYQGGNDYLAFFGNFLWDVQLNQVYHPKLMFQSTVSYKLAINSTSQDEYHKYAVSQELFQYNLKAGVKAARHWFYSFTTQFKTQFLNSYASNSMTRTASFLSPSELNLGVGMTYNLEKKEKRLTLGISIAPISYNLKTCIDDLVDHSQFGMEPGQRIKNEIGSNAEVNFYWAFRDNISYKTRLFLFSDYKNFTGDWENTLNFQFSKYFSTQLYLYFRYDTATDTSLSSWKKWMLKEILSVGLSYTFSTKK